jgi:uncharacterized membrane protein YphA (DoxX/SURF4 family)
VSRNVLRSGFLDWALRLLVALIFIFGGADKFGPSRLWIRLFADIGIGQWFRYFTGVVEIAGGVLLLVPGATRIAVTMLACTMVGAFITHVFITGFGPQTVAVAVLLTALLVIDWRRTAFVARQRSAAPTAAPEPERVGIA